MPLTWARRSHKHLVAIWRDSELSVTDDTSKNILAMLEAALAVVDLVK